MLSPGKFYRGWDLARLGVGAVLVLLFWFMAITLLLTEPALRSPASTFPDRAILYLLSIGAAAFGSFVWFVSAWRHVIAHWAPVRRWLLSRGVVFRDDGTARS